MNRLFAFADKALGVQLHPGQKQVLAEWIDSGCRKAVFCLGRRSGKGVMAAVVALYNAVIEDYSGLLRPGEGRFIIVVATREQQAREFIRVCRELLEQAPNQDLLAQVDEMLSEEIRFKNGVVIRALPCSSRSTRGLAVSLLVLDEAAHMSTADQGQAAGAEVYRALLPSTSQFGSRGYVMLTSTPNWRSGIFWDVYRAAAEGLSPDTFLAQRPTWEMNPAITRESLESEYRIDPDAAASEYGAQFSRAAGAYLDPTDVLACVRKGEGTLPPAPAVAYTAAIDPAFSRDYFTLAIGHLDKELDKLIVAGVWRWHKDGFEHTLDEVAAVCGRYGVRTVRTDQFSAQAVVEGLSRRHLGCEHIPWTNDSKWAAFSQLKASLATRQIELPDDEMTISELMNLEARQTISGLTRVAAAKGGHDDHAVVVAALCHSLQHEKPWLAFSPID